MLEVVHVLLHHSSRSYRVISGISEEAITMRCKRISLHKEDVLRPQIRVSEKPSDVYKKLPASKIKADIRQHDRRSSESYVTTNVMPRVCIYDWTEGQLRHTSSCTSNFALKTRTGEQKKDEKCVIRSPALNLRTTVIRLNNKKYTVTPVVGQLEFSPRHSQALSTEV
ncbi:hypothetical protein RRG08_055735 [Elysia crispata]|uniref:Uncharacterized protein n=1 Tax=Elysia crispata TaxID=231223 RepID=A0AAE1B122_9GAST|nr:hypothetical protein RRG08_055735 [Elysia crispata]